MPYNKRKQFKKAKTKREDLPSFISKLTASPDEFELPIKSTKSEEYLGCIFFGVCKGYHPPHHSLQFSKCNDIKYVAPARENYLDNILLPKTSPVINNLELPIFKPYIPRPKKLYDDPFPHKCPGVSKVFKQDVMPRVVDFGETTSRITGETSREIPYCRLRSISSRTSQQEVEIVTLSDIRERKRKYLSPEERAAHAHFLKEFIGVQVLGPKIPASIHITKIPSKRRKASDYMSNVIMKMKKKKGDKKQQRDVIEVKTNVSNVKTSYSVQEKDNIQELSTEVPLAKELSENTLQEESASEEAELSHISEEERQIKINGNPEEEESSSINEGNPNEEPSETIEVSKNEPIGE